MICISFVCLCGDLLDIEAKVYLLPILECHQKDISLRGCHDDFKLQGPLSTEGSYTIVCAHLKQVLTPSFSSNQFLVDG